MAQALHPCGITKKGQPMNITQTFYDSLATQYDKLFLDWQATTHEQAVILDRLFREKGFDTSAKLLDCACGIGTQAIGIAAHGYSRRRRASISPL